MKFIFKYSIAFTMFALIMAGHLEIANAATDSEGIQYQDLGTLEFFKRIKGNYEVYRIIHRDHRVQKEYLGCFQ